MKHTIADGTEIDIPDAAYQEIVAAQQKIGFQRGRTTAVEATMKQIGINLDPDEPRTYEHAADRVKAAIEAAAKLNQPANKEQQKDEVVNGLSKSDLDAALAAQQKQFVDQLAAKSKQAIYGELRGAAIAAKVRQSDIPMIDAYVNRYFDLQIDQAGAPIFKIRETGEPYQGQTGSAGPSDVIGYIAERHTGLLEPSGHKLPGAGHGESGGGKAKIDISMSPERMAAMAFGE